MVFLGIDWGKIFSAPFWLDVAPGDLSDFFEKMFLAALIICYVFYGASKLGEKRLIAKRSFIVAKFLNKIGNFLLTMAVSFTFIFFFRYEAIPFLGGRFWVLIWIIIGIIWLGYLIWYFQKVLPKQKQALEQKNKLKKYLPKK